MNSTQTTERTYRVGDSFAYYRTKVTITEVIPYEAHPDGYGYICRNDDKGTELARFFSAADLTTPYEGSDLQWQREGKEMYAKALARIAELEAAILPVGTQVTTTRRAIAGEVGTVTGIKEIHYLIHFESNGPDSESVLPASELQRVES